MRKETTIVAGNITWRLERSFHWVALSGELSVPEYRFLLYNVTEDKLMVLKGIADLAVALKDDMLFLQQLPPEGPSSPFWLMKAGPAAFVSKFLNFPEKIQRDYRKWAEKEESEGVLRLFQARMQGEIAIVKHHLTTMEESK